MKYKKGLLSLVFLMLSFALMADIVVLLTYGAAKLYLYFVRYIPFNTYLPGLLRLIKGASFGGMIADLGCWYMYYKNEKL